MNIGARPSIGDIQRERSRARRIQLQPQVQAALQAFAKRGVACAVIGSFARQSAIFAEGSDLDLLIESRAGLAEVELWEIEWANLFERIGNVVAAGKAATAGIHALCAPTDQPAAHRER